jgi:hypothetical protein
VSVTTTDTNSAGVTAAGARPTAQLAAIFEALGTWYTGDGFRGCAIVNAATQHHTEPVRQVAARHLDRYLTLLTDIAMRAHAKQPHRLARQLLMLIEGATVAADHHDTDGRSAAYAKQAALSLLTAATR